jgi:hypothetical protein
MDEVAAVVDQALEGGDLDPFPTERMEFRVQVSDPTAWNLDVLFDGNPGLGILMRYLVR